MFSYLNKRVEKLVRTLCAPLPKKAEEGSLEGGEGKGTIYISGKKMGLATMET